MSWCFREPDGHVQFPADLYNAKLCNDGLCLGPNGIFQYFHIRIPNRLGDCPDCSSVTAAGTHDLDWRASTADSSQVPLTVSHVSTIFTYFNYFFPLFPKWNKNKISFPHWCVGASCKNWPWTAKEWLGAEKHVPNK